MNQEKSKSSEDSARELFDSLSSPLPASFAATVDDDYNYFDMPLNEPYYSSKEEAKVHFMGKDDRDIKHSILVTFNDGRKLELSVNPEAPYKLETLQEYTEQLKTLTEDNVNVKSVESLWRP